MLAISQDQTAKILLVGRWRTCRLYPQKSHRKNLVIPILCIFILVSSAILIISSYKLDKNLEISTFIYYLCDNSFL